MHFHLVTSLVCIMGSRNCVLGFDWRLDSSNWSVWPQQCTRGKSRCSHEWQEQCVLIVPHSQIPDCQMSRAALPCWVSGPDQHCLRRVKPSFLLSAQLKPLVCKKKKKKKKKTTKKTQLQSGSFELSVNDTPNEALAVLLHVQKVNYSLTKREH